ncbi:unnamed protein product, partial [Schistocephalus solidus]|uniref:Glycerate kinase n=1 Tax=Schistocephalus solidus TaxID=70667 RepID=A0A183T0A1_SCHSO
LFSLRDVKSQENKPVIDTFHGPRTNEPDEEVLKASVLMAKLSSEMKAGDLLLVCITGGGSAMLTLPSCTQRDTDPVDDTVERIPLQSIVKMTRLLSLCGASIQEINSVRSCLDAMKAGGLARLAAPAQVVSLIVSDVVGDPIEFIASGPTFIREDEDYCNPFVRAKAVIDKYGLDSKLPEPVKKFFDERSDEGSFLTLVGPKPANHIIGNIHMALVAAAKEAAAYLPIGIISTPSTVIKKQLNRTPVDQYQVLLPIVLTGGLTGDMQEKADSVAELAWHLRSLIQTIMRTPDFLFSDISPEMKDAICEAHARLLRPEEHDYSDLLFACLKLANDLKSLQSIGKPAPAFGLCLLFGGEATVKIRPPSSRSPVNGGRCSHAALTTALRWYHLRTQSGTTPSVNDANSCHVEIEFLARASDGLDGPSAYGAGAWSSSDLIQSPKVAELASDCLKRGDSYGFFDRVQSQDEKKLYLPACLTGTNVMDLFICLLKISGST